MKKRNLEKAVILGLLLSTSIYGTAWASAVGIKPDGTEVKLNDNYEGGLYIDYNYTELGDNALTDYKEVEINVENDVNRRVNGLSLVGYQLIAPDTDFDITINRIDTAHGIYLARSGGADDNVPTYFEIGNYTANISALDSDAFKISAQVYGDDVKAVVNNDFNATVANGNGINISASRESDVISEFNVKGNTKITINSGAIENTYDVLFHPAPYTDVTVKYDPAAVYAGDTECYFTTNGYPVNGELFDKPLPDGTISDPGTYGYETDGMAKVDLSGKVEIETNGEGNYGIFAGKNGEINLNSGVGTNGLNSDLVITANGKNSIGIAAQNRNLIFDDSAHIYTEVNIQENLGWYEGTVNENLDQSENTYGSTVILNGTNNTITMADGGKALYADAKNSTANDKEVIIKSGDGGIGNLDVKGDVVATNSGIIDLTVNKAADITGDIEATNSGVINFTLGDNADMIVSEKDNTLINAGGASTLSLAKNGSESKIGNVQAANGGTINLTLGEGAYFAGRVDDYKDADGANGNWNNVKHQTLFDSEFAAGVTKSGTVNMTLNGGVWNLTQQSWVSKIDGNSGLIYLDGDGTGGYAVHIGKLEGDHTFVVNLNPNDYAASDMIYIYDGSSAGVQNLRINNEAEVLNALKDDGDRIRFATVGKTAGAGAGFGDDYVVRGRGVINSGFSIDYVDYEEDKQNADYTTDYNGDNFDVDKPGNSYVENVYGEANGADDIDSQNLYLVRDSSKDAGKSDSGATIINMSRANYKNAIYMDRLNKRMGEMRYLNGEEDQGMWVRLRHDRIGQSGDFRSMNTMYEIGYDVKQPVDSGEHRIGFAVDYMKGSTTYDDIMGKGETKRYGLWLYDTWLGEKGHYTDYIVKWGHLSNDFDIRDKDSLENITGDYSNNVFSVSAEYGKKNDMGNNWYFEPQAQLQLARVTGADYVTTQGSKVNVDGINSLIGRAGFRIGRDMDENSTVYLKADLLHEFMGDQTVTAADATGTLREEFENKGTWYDVGFGFVAKMSKNSYAFMDFEKSFGNDNDETYQINAGMQWSF